MADPIYTRQDDTGRTIYSNLPRSAPKPAAVAPVYSDDAEPGDSGFDWSRYDEYLKRRVDPVASAKSFLDQPDFFNPEQSNGAAARETLAPKPAPAQAATGGLPSALKALIPSASSLAGTAAVAGANYLAPEIAWPAEALAGGAAGYLADRAQGGEHPIAGSVEGALAGLPIGKPLGWAGSKIRMAGEAAAKVPWFARMLGGKMLGNEAGEAAATFGPAVARGVGGGMERAGAAMGEDTIGGKVAKWAKGLLGDEPAIGSPDPYAPNASGYKAHGGFGESAAPFEAGTGPHVPNQSGYSGSGGFGEPAESFGEPVIDRYAPNKGSGEYSSSYTPSEPAGGYTVAEGEALPETAPAAPAAKKTVGSIGGQPMEKGGFDKLPDSVKQMLGLATEGAESAPATAAAATEAKNTNGVIHSLSDKSIPDLAGLGQESLARENKSLISKIANRPEGTAFNYDTGKIEPIAPLPDQRPLVGYSSLGEPIRDLPNIAQSHLKMPEKGTKDLATELLQRTSPGLKVTGLKTYPQPTGDDALSKALRQRAHIAGKGYTMPAIAAGIAGLQSAHNRKESK